MMVSGGSRNATRCAHRLSIPSNPNAMSTATPKAIHAPRGGRLALGRLLLMPAAFPRSAWRTQDNRVEGWLDAALGRPVILAVIPPVVTRRDSHRVTGLGPRPDLGEPYSLGHGRRGAHTF